MTVSAALEDLIRRMVTPCRENDSSRSVSWAAHREAEQLRDPQWVEALAREGDKQSLAGGLDGVAAMPKPASLDLSLVRTLLGDPRWLVRQAAMGALRNAEDPGVEAWLLSLLETTEDADDQICCHSTLGTLGTAAAIPLLERGAQSRKRDVRMSAEQALEAIRSRQEGPR